MLHEPLSEEQQTKYEQMKQGGGFITSDFAADQKAIQEAAEKETEEEEDDEFSLEENILTDDTQEVPGKDELDIQVKTVDVSQYNTLNLQKELAESMKEILDDHKRPEAPNEPPAKADQGAEPVRQETVSNQKTQIYEPVNGLDDHAGSEKKVQATKTAPRLRPQNFAGSNSNEEVFFGNTEEVNIQDVVFELEQKNGSKTLFTPIGESELQKEEERKEPPASTDSALSNTGVIRTFHKPSGYDNMLTQEYDGQLSLVVPEQDKVEKQITGQLSIEDIMAEWEKMKQDNERKRMEDIRKRVQQQTDTLFADFDESTRSGLLEELEKAMVTAAMKEEKLKIAKERLGLLKTVDGAKNKKSQSLKKEEPQFPEEKEEETAAEAAKEEPAPEKEKEEPPKAESLWTRENLTLEELEEKLWQEAEAEMEGNAEGDYGEEEDGKASREEETADAEQQMSDELETGKQNAAEGSLETEEGEDKHTVREMTGSERELFAPFIHHKRTRRQIVETIDNISMASFTGNVIITGEEGTGTIALAKLLVKEVQLSDSNFSGKVAKISGSTMNRKDVASTLGKLSGGALIVEAASFMKKAAVEQLLKALNQEGKGLIVLLEDTKAAMEEFLATYPELLNTFNLRVDVEALDDQTLVRYARKYALEQEYAIDELGVLALHTRIADMQTSDHEVTLAEIEELVDEAIYYADKKTPKHFFDVLLGKRYDEEDMIVLRENDFMHY